MICTSMVLMAIHLSVFCCIPHAPCTLRTIVRSLRTHATIHWRCAFFYPRLLTRLRIAPHRSRELIMMKAWCPIPWAGSITNDEMIKEACLIGEFLNQGGRRPGSFSPKSTTPIVARACALVGRKRSPNTKKSPILEYFLPETHLVVGRRFYEQ